MAVDAHNLLLSPPQFFSNREIFINNNTIMEPTSDGFYTNNNQTIYGVVSPFLDNTPRPPHMYGSADNDFSLLPTRKRSRDYSTSNYYYNNQNLTSSSSFSFLGQNIDISTHMNQQQHEIDRFVSLHMEKMRFEIEEKRKKQVRMIMEAIEQRLVKRLRVKEEEKERLQKVNNALEERVKSLAVENQIWRDIAQSNEATANNLRINLEQVLANVKDVQTGDDDDGDDAESWCGSRTAEEDDGERRRRKCRKCGEKESCVLLLPCRHLCLCGVCGSHVDTCPICASPKNASVHVNMSS